MLGKLIDKIRGKVLPDHLTYEDARELLEEERGKNIRALAGRPDTRPEMLYYLASNKSPVVRRKVAENPAAPVQANEILADDQDDEVRCDLARKIARLLPDLEVASQARLRERTLKVLAQLADDQLPRVRQIIAEEIKESRHVPKNIVQQLARDVELMVCAPVLEYSPLLGDDDLREIIATTQVKGALTAIAQRRQVSGTVADEVAATLDIPAVAALLANKNAQIREDTLDRIIDHAEKIEAWHEPVAMRPSLSLRVLKRIAGFVASSLVEAMVREHELDDDLAADLLRNVRRRISDEGIGDEERDSAARAAKKMFDAGALDENAVSEAIDLNRRDMAVHCTALLAEMPARRVYRIIESRNGRAITALVWKAGLGMRTALRMQRDIAHVPPAQIVNAKNGFDYPCTDQEMIDHLALFQG